MSTSLSVAAVAALGDRDPSQAGADRRSHLVQRATRRARSVVANVSQPSAWAEQRRDGLRRAQQTAHDEPRTLKRSVAVSTALLRPHPQRSFGPQSPLPGHRRGRSATTRRRPRRDGSNSLVATLLPRLRKVRKLSCGQRTGRPSTRYGRRRTPSARPAHRPSSYGPSPATPSRSALTCRRRRRVHKLAKSPTRRAHSRGCRTRSCERCCKSCWSRMAAFSMRRRTT